MRGCATTLHPAKRGPTAQLGTRDSATARKEEERPALAWEHAAVGV